MTRLSRSPATRGTNGTQLLPCTQAVKFTEKENTEIYEARLWLGLTFQSFARDLLVRAARATLQEKRNEEEAEAQKKRTPFVKRETRGLGIREHFAQQRVDEAMASAAQADTAASMAAPPSVVPVHVHVQPIGGPSPTTGEAAEIEELANDVVNGGPGFERATRMRKAVAKLATRAKSREDATRLALELDNAIVRLRAPSTLERVKARIGRPKKDAAK